VVWAILLFNASSDVVSGRGEDFSVNRSCDEW
jgi:hypothetical protein